MWEHDDGNGKKKLKKDAVPTIFGDAVSQVKIAVKIGKLKYYFNMDNILNLYFQNMIYLTLILF